MTDSHKGGDALGLRPFGEATKILAQGAVDGAGAFLGRICLPAAEEFGLFLRDKVSRWRARNAAVITTAAEEMIEASGGAVDKQAHPRIVGKVLDHGSWEDDEAVQKMWAGLLASACTTDGKDQSNLVFINLLEQMTSAQARLLQSVCEIASVYLSPQGYLQARTLTVPCAEAMTLLGLGDIHDVDIQLDHMREIGVLHGGLNPYSDRAEVTPSALGLHLYARSKGFRGAPTEFFTIEVPEVVVDPGPRHDPIEADDQGQ